MEAHYVINIGRQLGSGGRAIGEKLAESLGVAYYDKELINIASQESGLCKEFFRETIFRAMLFRRTISVVDNRYCEILFYLVRKN